MKVFPCFIFTLWWVFISALLMNRIWTPWIPNIMVKMEKTTTVHLLEEIRLTTWHLLKPCKQWDIYHINWLAGFVNHQQYHQRIQVPKMEVQQWHQAENLWLPHFLTNTNHSKQARPIRLKPADKSIFTSLPHKCKPNCTANFHFGGPLAGQCSHGW